MNTILLLLLANLLYYVNGLTGCEKVSNALSKPKVMILQNTNPKMKHLVNDVIKDIVFLTKIPENKVKSCITYKNVNRYSNRGRIN
jgi:hypothetical protein